MEIDDDEIAAAADSLGRSLPLQRLLDETFPPLHQMSPSEVIAFCRASIPGCTLNEILDVLNAAGNFHDFKGRTLLDSADALREAIADGTAL